jgi:hypothetical protein
MAYIHPINQTPAAAVIAVGIATTAATFLGQAGLVPILEVGAVASATGWMAACASYYRMKPEFAGRAAALAGLLVTSLMVLAKVIPVVPGHFTRYEWMSLALWGGLGVLAACSRTAREIPEAETLGVSREPTALRPNMD